jgi:hypothetical protein
MEKGLTRNEMITELTKSPHGALAEYVGVGLKAAVEEGEFFAHLIAWNGLKGQIRDAKVALPVIHLMQTREPEYEDNAYAHLAQLDPRNLVRAERLMKTSNATAVDFKKKYGADFHVKARPFYKMIERYLRHKESNWALWERVTVQHRKSMKELYALTRVKPSGMADAILFKGEAPTGTVFHDIRNLSKMSVVEAAGAIIERRIPFLIAVGALGARIKDGDLVLALIERMTPTELITNTKMLERLGVKTDPKLRAAYEQGLLRASLSKKTTFKATQAAEALEDEGLKEKLKAVQEKQIRALGGVEGDWLVLGDKSGSMSACIEVARHVAATLAKMVKGKIHLVYFDTQPTYIDATGMDYDTLLKKTKFVTANGGTSIGVGVSYITAKFQNVDGIAIVSDGCENTVPYFADAYRKLATVQGKEPTVYFYHLGREPKGLRGLAENAELDRFSQSLKEKGIEVDTFSLGKTIDYYSVPNLAQTMRVNRFSLADEILETPLLKLEAVLPVKVGASS